MKSLIFHPSDMRCCCCWSALGCLDVNVTCESKVTIFLVLSDLLLKLAFLGVRSETFPSTTESLSSSPLTRRHRTLCSLPHASASTRGSWHCAWATTSCTCGAESQTRSRCSRWRHRPGRRNRQSSKKGQSWEMGIPKAWGFIELDMQNFHLPYRYTHGSQSGQNQHCLSDYVILTATNHVSCVSQLLKISDDIWFNIGLLVVNAW